MPVVLVTGGRNFKDHLRMVQGLAEYNKNG